MQCVAIKYEEKLFTRPLFNNWVNYVYLNKIFIKFCFLATAFTPGSGTQWRPSRPGIRRPRPPANWASYPAGGLAGYTNGRRVASPAAVALPSRIECRRCHATEGRAWPWPKDVCRRCSIRVKVGGGRFCCRLLKKVKGTGCYHAQHTCVPPPALSMSPLALVQIWLFGCSPWRWHHRK